MYYTEFHEDKGSYDIGRIVVRKPGSSVTCEHWAFNVTPHGGIELPKFRDEAPPKEVWEKAIHCLLENVDQEVSPVFKGG